MSHLIPVGYKNRPRSLFLISRQVLNEQAELKMLYTGLSTLGCCIRYGTLVHFTCLAGGFFINQEIAGDRESPRYKLVGRLPPNAGGLTALFIIFFKYSHLLVT